MKKHFGGPQIVAKLRQADVLIGQGKTVKMSFSLMMTGGFIYPSSGN